MSFQLPSRVPAFSSSQREVEDGYWRARSNAGGANGGFDFADKIGQFISPNRELPMYKDKPYNAGKRGGAGSSGVGGRAGRKRRQVVLLGVLVVFGVTVWWLWVGGRADSLILRGKGLKSMHGGELWKWVQGFEKDENGKKGKTVNWAERRERVKDAFMVSWDGYEKYAWGKSVRCPSCERRMLIVFNFEVTTNTTQSQCPGGIWSKVEWDGLSSTHLIHS